MILPVLALLAAPPAPGLDRTEKRIAEAVDRGLPAALDLLQRSVDIPSPTEDVAGVRRVGDLFRAELDALGFATRWVDLPPEMARAGHLVAEREGRGKRVLLIGHLDTVISGQPFVRDGDHASGTGTVDMKGGDVVIVAALRALRDARALDGRRLAVVFTGDEEDPGEPVDVARAALVEAARKSDAALAFEAAAEDTATIARRGVSTWTLAVTAEGAHSSGIFRADTGSGAAFEIARILHQMHEELAGERYLTFNPSLVLAGTEVAGDAAAHRGTAAGKTNVIAARAWAEGDLRFVSVEQREEAKRRMLAIAARSQPPTSATLTFADSYPPMAPTEGNLALLRVLDQVSRDLGYAPVVPLDAGERGAGDVSFVAHVVSGLDGLGARGHGAHTPEEGMDLASLRELIARTAILIHRLTR